MVMKEPNASDLGSRSELPGAAYGRALALPFVVACAATA